VRWRELVSRMPRLILKPPHTTLRDGKQVRGDFCLRVPAIRDDTYCWDAIFAGEFRPRWNELRGPGRSGLWTRRDGSCLLASHQDEIGLIN
jgi:hypothetical protein